MSYKDSISEVALEKETEAIFTIKGAQKITKGDGDVQREHPNSNVGWSNS